MQAISAALDPIMCPILGSLCFYTESIAAT